MKRKPWIYLGLVILFFLTKQLLAQTIQSGMEEEVIRCVTDIYRDELDQSFQKRIALLSNRLKSRSSNGDLEIHFHIDTSYERRRTGGYNNNSQVVTYMTNLTNQVVSKFNVAAPNWDVNKAITITFFDGATPFAYGNGIVATIENYLDWLISNNFPGDDDVYVFYTGHYTNVGVTYLGTLCWPGVSLTGFVSSQIPNESLSSHEWMGHSANSIHYDNEPNIMKSTNATFPWHSSSLDEMEEYLDLSSCVENVQSPLALEDIETEIECVDKDNISLSLRILNQDRNGIIKTFHSSDGKAWDFLNEVVLESGNQEIFLDFKASKLLDYIKLIQCDLNGKDLQSEIYKVPRCTKVQWKIVDGILYNPENDAIRIFDLTGRLLKQTMEPELNLYLSLNSGFLVLTDGRHHVEVWCP